MHNGNGHSIETMGGTKGGRTHRRHREFFAKVAALGEGMLETDVGPLLAFAREILHDPAANTRERLRAGEFIQRFWVEFAKITQHDDKAQQADEHLVAKLATGMIDDGQIEVRIVRGARAGLNGNGTHADDD